MHQIARDFELGSIAKLIFTNFIYFVRMTVPIKLSFKALRHTEDHP